MNVELGGGTLTTPGWVNLDPIHGTGDWRRAAQHVPWPAVDNTVEQIRASHVLEHIPAGADRINVFNEAHRVLRPGGTFTVVVPLLVGTWHAVADPTHLSFWVPESFGYFVAGGFAANADYGIRYWEQLAWEVRDGWEGHWTGAKPCE